MGIGGLRQGHVHGLTHVKHPEKVNTIAPSDRSSDRALRLTCKGEGLAYAKLALAGHWLGAHIGDFASVPAPDALASTADLSPVAGLYASSN